jgi:hypothetical protein
MTPQGFHFDIMELIENNKTLKFLHWELKYSTLTVEPVFTSIQLSLSNVKHLHVLTLLTTSGNVTRTNVLTFFKYFTFIC